MPYTATLQQYQRNNTADQINITVRFDGTGASAGNTIVRDFSFTSDTMPTKTEFKAIIAAFGTKLAQFDTAVGNYIQSNVGKDVSTL